MNEINMSMIKYADMGQRNSAIDLVKVIAMFSVIGLHSFDAFMEWHYVNVLYESCVIAIPLFFMCSGFLILNRKSVTIEYALRKAIRIIRFLILLVLAYWIISSVSTKSLDIQLLMDLILGIVLLKGPLLHCWYLGAMILVYMTLPLLNKLFHRRNGVIVLLTFFFLIESVVFIENLIYDSPFESKVPESFRIWNWLYYFLLGGIIGHYHGIVSGFRQELLGSIVVLLLFNIVFQEHLRGVVNTPFCEFFYSSFVVILLSACIFSYILSLDVQKTKWLNALSELFLPVYIFHPAFVPISNRLCFAAFPVELALFSRFLVVSFLAIVFSYIFMKIPYMKYVFRI